MRASWAPPGTGRPVRSPDEATEAVVRTADEGADVIKVALNPAAGPTLDRETLEAIVDRAHELGLRVTGHVYGLAELDKALDAGMDELAHMLMSAERIPDKTIERMVGQGMTVVPTLSIRFGRDQEIAVDNVARFVSAGGRIVYGTDLGNEGPKPGIDRREIEAMQRTGMSGRDIIFSATVHAARYLKLESKGVLAPGMDADLVAVAGDPLSDIRSLTRVKLVWREGRRVL
jgi:imidazolonepropionase-like amidohydrolase